MAQHDSGALTTHDSDTRRKGARRRRAVVITLVAALFVAALAGGALWIRGGATFPLFGGHVAGMITGERGVMSADDAEQHYPLQPSATDYDGDGVDDYTDILHGAAADSKARPAYDDGYYQGGYPPADKGACTDVVWRAFREAGYDLKAMIDADVAADPASYAGVSAAPDPNIDFRRTGVLDVFFAKYAQTLTADTADKAAWQAGDIVVFEHTRHIGVVSDKRDVNGMPFIHHNMGQQNRENDYLAFRTHMAVTGHYRFDASRIPASVLKAWEG